MFTDNYDEHLANVDKAINSGILESQRGGVQGGEDPEAKPAE